jgi:site-specific recombinase XerD
MQAMLQRSNLERNTRKHDIKMAYRVILKNITHKERPQAAILFDYDHALKGIITQFKDCLWSQTHRCFYIPNNRATCNLLYVHLKKHKVFVDYSNFKIASAAHVKPAARVPSAHEQELLNRFRDYLEGKRYSTSTIETYGNLAKLFISYMQHRPIATATGDELRLFIEQTVKAKSYSISTHRQLVSALKLLLTLHKNTSEIGALDRPKKSDYKPVVLNNVEIITLLQCTVNLKHRCILAILYSCGLRVSEVLAIEKSDIDLERMQLHVRNGKGRKDRYVGIATSVIPLLLNYTKSYNTRRYVFEGANGAMYSTNSVRAFLKRSCEAAQITKHVTPHTLRHSYATHLVENGTGIAHIQRLLGHAKPETTMLYTHIANTDLVKIENPLDVAVNKKRATDKNNRNIDISRKF